MSNMTEKKEKRNRRKSLQTPGESIFSDSMFLKLFNSLNFNDDDLFSFLFPCVPRLIINLSSGKSAQERCVVLRFIIETIIYRTNEAKRNPESCDLQFVVFEKR